MPRTENATIKAHAPKADTEPAPGYRLVQLLGKGGYGEVWETERGDGSRVALKFIPCESGISAAREIRALQTIRQKPHPNLVTIDQIWSQPGYVVITMELAEATLADLLAVYQGEFGTPIVPELVCLYLTQAAEALDFLHAKQYLVDGRLVGVQHLDVKPSNMLLFGDTVKLSDFGLSAPNTARVQPHRRAGTKLYAAPEVFEGKLTPHSDQYSLAVTYCELRGGRFPFEPPASFRPGTPCPTAPADLSMLSPEEQPILRRALDRIPQNRWPSCQDLMAELSKVVAG